MYYDVSVILPVYNAAAYLREAMKSLLTQSIGFNKLQITAVDDCSTDDSYHILSEYARKYSNVEVYRTKKNSGAAGTPRNIGLDHVKSPYVMFLDPDDYFDSDACKVLYDKIMEVDVDIVCGCCSIVDIHGNNPSPIYPLTMEVLYTCPLQAVEVMKVMGSCSCHIIKEEFISENSIRFTPEGFGQDTAFLCKSIARPCRYMYIPNVIYYYRQNNQSVTHVLSELYFKKNIPSVLEVKKALENNLDAYQFKLSALSEYYFFKSVYADNIDENELSRIYCECSTLFNYSNKYISTDEALIGLEIINNRNEGLAAKYALVVRKHLKECVRLREHICQQEKRISEFQEHICQQEKKISEFQEKVFQKDSTIQCYRERFVSQVADAVHQKQFGMVLRLCAEKVIKSVTQ